ncbi:MAG: hypothetical protein ACRDKJ_04765, partial [Actinomycetota bacterium]
NLLLLCRFHHRLVHEGGWSAEIGPDGELSIRRPDGSHMRRHSLTAPPELPTASGHDCRGP